MTNPNWLDEERRATQVYAVTIHHACICRWERHHAPGEEQVTDHWVLRERKAHCVIHGKNGSH